MLVQKEARLGEENKFFYDKERGMWREQGAEIPAAAAPLPPPPAIRRAPDSAPSAGAPLFTRPHRSLCHLISREFHAGNVKVIVFKGGVEYCQLVLYVQGRRRRPARADRGRSRLPAAPGPGPDTSTP